MFTFILHLELVFGNSPIVAPVTANMRQHLWWKPVFLAVKDRKQVETSNGKIPVLQEMPHSPPRKVSHIHQHFVCALHLHTMRLCVLTSLTLYAQSVFLRSYGPLRRSCSSVVVCRSSWAFAASDMFGVLIFVLVSPQTFVRSASVAAPAADTEDAPRCVACVRLHAPKCSLDGDLDPENCSTCCLNRG